MLKWRFANLIYDSRTLMRPSRGLPLRFQATLVVLFFVAALFPTSAQISNPLPQPWNDAVAKLADKIAADVSPLSPLSLELKNSSPFSPVEAAIVRDALEVGLKSRSFRLTRADSTVETAQSETRVQFTISEATDGCVLVAEIRSGAEPGAEPQVAIVLAPKSAPSSNGQGNESLLLEKRLVWQQSGKFLDFMLLPGNAVGSPSFLAILEPERLAYFRPQDGNWRFIQAITIKHSPRRDLSGAIDNEGKSVSVSGVTCTGDLEQPQTLKCASTGSPMRTGVYPEMGDEAEIGSPCEGRAAYLETGTGDWTQTDSIQGYQSGQEYSVSGAPIETPGPVMSLRSGAIAGTARAVVYNLKTRNYEAYIVTATCSR